MDNIPMINGHVRSGVPMKDLVTKFSDGFVFQSFPFNSNNIGSRTLTYGSRPADAEFWLLPRW